MEKDDALQRMLNFLNLLNEKGIHFYIEQQDEDSLRVTLTLVGVRIEAVFAVEDMTFSVFRGDESVQTEQKLLLDLIDKHWD
jgi:hypothetical protein